jgi:hypothetical protein
MKRWILHEYPDRHSPLSEPQSVGVYEAVDSDCLFTQNEAVLNAISNLKKRRPRCLPLALIEHEPVEVFHIVHLSGEYDAVFQSIELAHCWVEQRVYESRLAQERVVNIQVTSQLVEGFPSASAPKTVWDWLREPAPYSFDAP